MKNKKVFFICQEFIKQNNFIIRKFKDHKVLSKVIWIKWSQINAKMEDTDMVKNGEDWLFSLRFQMLDKFFEDFNKTS